MRRALAVVVAFIVFGVVLFLLSRKGVSRQTGDPALNGDPGNVRAV